MHRIAFALVLIFTPSIHAADWSQFRGPTQDGHADESKLPTEWDLKQNVTWRKGDSGEGVVVAGGGRGQDLPDDRGAGGGEGRHVAAGAVPRCQDRRDRVERGGVQAGSDRPGIHSKNSHASPTPVVDGGQIFVHFGHMGTACLNTKDGSRVWAQQSLKYSPVHGNGGSPILAGDKLVFCIDGSDKQMIVGLERKTGKVAWQTPRDVNPFKGFSFCTPLLITVDGKEQVIAPGSEVVMSLDPKSGKEIWRVRYNGYSVVPRPIYSDGLVYLSRATTRRNSTRSR